MPSIIIIRPSLLLLLAIFATTVAAEVCEDDASFSFRGITCANTAEKQFRIDQRCPQERNGQKFSDFCPVTCGTCPTPTTSDAPTMAPPDDQPTDPPTTVDESTCDAAFFENGIPADDRRRSYVAAELCDMIYYGEDSDDFDQDPMYDGVFGGPGPDNRGMYYESGVDAVYLARIQDDYCAVVYRGTVADSLEGWLSNVAVAPTPFRLTPDDDNQCEVHSGFHDAYLTLQAEVEDFLSTCTSECPGCEVVITGHSQGGGIAEMASLFYQRNRLDGGPVAGVMNPVHVPVFAAPQAMGQGCLKYFTKVERCKHLRYIMSLDYAGIFTTGRGYDTFPLVSYQALELLDDTLDFIPGINISGSNYARNGGLLMLGYELFLNQEDSSTLSLANFDDHYAIDVINWDVLLGFEAHSSTTYARILKEQSEADYSIDGRSCNLPTDGFPNGSTCNQSENDLNCVEDVGTCKTRNFLSFTYKCRSYGGSVPLDEDRFCEA
eukprot:CAMPEP_0197173466 /NCGR_PEP_ID=MMETSP1423-20130617/387_1 /TAXON_ID=476441 /ORGANISM="Pseudo-nitzschia heimii, Strain UNC1101" /LENGTH=491 /DNA_ID=CAMNT_0042622287 /DNA_START=148 /DNA_END=1623 /DNA_ORIENTATION=-